MGYFGSKATSGLCQPLIAMMPPHDTYIETHLGGGAIMRRKPAALHNIGIDRDARALGEFECDYRVELIHGCAHRFLSEYAFEGSELLYSDPPYLSYTHCDHALCGAHLLRELAFIVDAHGYAWAKRMKRLLLGACHQVSKRDDKTLTPSEYKALQKRYRTILTQGARELPPIPPRQNGQRGKVAKSDAHNLWERMRNYETAVLRFAKHPDVAFTNNRAERDLRMAKVKQKVSGCFRTRKYAEAYCRISSYLQSMANQGYNPLVAIQIALAGRAVDNMGE